MKMRYMTGLLLGLFALQGVASAEMISGTITSIDPSGKITLLRSDTRDSITVRVQDNQALSSLQTGNSVTLDADKKLFGGWVAQSVEGETAVRNEQANEQAVESQEGRHDAQPSAADMNRAESELNVTADVNMPADSSVNAGANASSDASGAAPQGI